MTTVRTAAGGLAPAWLAATVAAALVTTAAARLARSAGATFAADGREIPSDAFWFWTVVGALLGLVTALVVRDRHRFVRLAVAGTAVSMLPAVLAPDDAGSRVALVLIHLLAAVVLVPAIGWRLPTDADRPAQAVP